MHHCRVIKCTFYKYLQTLTVYESASRHWRLGRMTAWMLGQWSLRAEVCLAPRLCGWQAEVDRRDDLLLHVVPGGIASQGQQDTKDYTLSFKRIWASIGVGKFSSGLLALSPTKLDQLEKTPQKNKD